MDRSVLVYRGEGAGWRSVRSTVDSVQRLLSGPLKPYIKPLKVCGRLLLQNTAPSIAEAEADSTAVQACGTSKHFA
jgi:hypothetical protein